jgi:hypothetical protein
MVTVGIAWVSIGVAEHWRWIVVGAGGTGAFCSAALTFYFAFKIPMGARTPPTPLERAIRDGRALLKQMSPQWEVTSKVHEDQVQAWVRETDQMIRREYGVGAVFGFYGARNHDSRPGLWIPKQIKYLETLAPDPVNKADRQHLL